MQFPSLNEAVDFTIRELWDMPAESANLLDANGKEVHMPTRYILQWVDDNKTYQQIYTDCNKSKEKLHELITARVAHVCIHYSNGRRLLSDKQYLKIVSFMDGVSSL